MFPTYIDIVKNSMGAVKPVNSFKCQHNIWLCTFVESPDALVYNIKASIYFFL